MNAVTEAEITLASVKKSYEDFILKEDHPCIMAKTLFKMELYNLNVYRDIDETESLAQLVEDVKRYVAQYDFEGNTFESFLAVFPNNHYRDEESFETALWKALQTIHDLDESAWDPTVSDDPEDPQFSFSVGGKAFYIVGLHPESSRMARRAPFTTLVFNLHHQFEKLREMGTYHAVRNTIRKNDQELQGSINPVLRDHGTDTETKQYSGRQVEEGWKCPFHK
ncbi:guanitoxin biosynthesis heme-dependent pre-guanitoxin N-hydroxylase GntA [Chryseobacterium sp.]|uniref:guanitoxin biosynthesis heme-dependent pre-guanitoxin N-hydroxylase GntA n=1 Tax=Chryseobacterium sp. TaxID=1871047 RepID=UPI0011C84232|nr:guanitoxin biosynthesis heme-dependent pre-guanitoxin N-hydroxylase GntA [Chryseobacterium sp.]TXF79474.1 YqcI/YcgG family protein [Chryseobacterium sp.]